jgi:hypothetical protein
MQKAAAALLPERVNWYSGDALDLYWEVLSSNLGQYVGCRYWQRRKMNHKNCNSNKPNIYSVAIIWKVSIAYHNMDTHRIFKYTNNSKTKTLQ